MSAPRTSESDPIEIGWIVERRVGLTLAPGKQGASELGRPWKRDLAADVRRLAELGTGTLVSLVEDAELKALAIPDLAEVARSRSIVVERFPIADGDVPSDPSALRRLVDRIVELSDSGEVVVIHCRGGLGRAGTIGGCVLVALGHSADEAFEILERARGPRCPENDRQRALIRGFAAALVVRPSVRVAPCPPSALGLLDDRAARIAGCVLGAAIGDAVGHPTEFVRSLDEIRARFGPRGVEGYALWRERNGRRFAPYTDDTQMAEAVLRSLVGGLAAGDDLDGVMVRVARAFVAWSIRPQGGHRAPGGACLAGCWALEQGVPWHSAGAAEAGGCGSVMRAYPFGLIFADDLERAERWAVQHSLLTHGHPIALAACAAMAIGTARALRGEDPDAIGGAMVDAAARHSPETAAMVERAASEARGGTPPEITLGRLEGWAAHEAIAAAVYVFMRHPDDARAAILEGANTIGDSDSIATLAGALVGARLGVGALPAEWVRDLERVEELAGLAIGASRLRLTERHDP